MNESESQRRSGQASAFPPSIELEIEQLVLDGFSVADRHRIGQAVQQELSRLLAEGGLPLSLTGNLELTHLDGGVFEAGQGAAAETIGSSVAQSLYATLTQ